MPAAIARGFARCSRPWRCAAPSRAGDLVYLANLCHQCGACLPDCQYAPPHQFDVNVPAALATLRNDSYAAYAWPGFMAGVFARNGLAIALACAASVAAVRRRLCRFCRSGGAVVGAMPAISTG